MVSSNSVSYSQCSCCQISQDAHLPRNPRIDIRQWSVVVEDEAGCIHGGMKGWSVIVLVLMHVDITPNAGRKEFFCIPDERWTLLREWKIVRRRWAFGTWCGHAYEIWMRCYVSSSLVATTLELTCIMHHSKPRAPSSIKQSVPGWGNLFHHDVPSKVLLAVNAISGQNNFGISRLFTS